MYRLSLRLIPEPFAHFCPKADNPKPTANQMQNCCFASKTRIVGIIPMSYSGQQNSLQVHPKLLIT
jgi:hypothetical protein